MPDKENSMWAVWGFAVILIISLSITYMVDRARYLEYQNSQGKASRNLPIMEEK